MTNWIWLAICIAIGFILASYVVGVEVGKKNERDKLFIKRKLKED